MLEPYPVTSLGGGLNLSAHPAFIADHEWSWSNGMVARDGAAEVTTGDTLKAAAASVVPASNAVIGLWPDFLSTACLVATRNTSTEVVRLFQVTSGGTVTEKAVSGTAPTSSDVGALGAGPLVCINGRQVLWFGTTSASDYSCATYNGTNFFRIAPSDPLMAHFMTSANGHLIAGWTANTIPGRRTIRICGAGSYSEWDPDISNDADEFTLDGPGEVRALCPAADGAFLQTTYDGRRLRSTGGSPPFTATILHGVGQGNVAYNYATATPYGVFFQTTSELFTEGGPVPAARKVAHLLSVPSLTSGYVGSPMAWHPARRALMVPRTSGRLYFDPVTGTWWRMTWPAAPFYSVIWNGNSSAWQQYTVTPSGDVYVENFVEFSGAYSGAFLDTKDFSFGSPQQADYTQSIKVDWEPLTDATTDAITVYAYARNDLSPGILGANTMAMDLSAQFTLLGTLTGGASELPVRLKGKFVRYRFEQSSGRARIRGFTLMRERANDRRAAA